MALPATIYALLRNLTYLTIEGAASVTLDEADNVVEVYDLDSHRNLFDAGTIGRAWAVGIAEGVGSPGPNVAGAIAGNAVTWTNQNIEAGTDGLPPEALDDRVSKTAPTPTLKQRTMIKWWSGAGGTGDPIAMCWSDQFVGYSGGIPKFVQ